MAKSNKELIKYYKEKHEAEPVLFSEKTGKDEVSIDGIVTPLKLDLRQFCSPTDDQGETCHCAAYTAVDKAEENKALCKTLNTVAPAYLAAAIEKRGGWMIQISTDYVFNGTKHKPYVETDTPCPDSV